MSNQCLTSSGLGKRKNVGGVRTMVGNIRQVDKVMYLRHRGYQFFRLVKWCDVKRREVKAECLLLMIHLPCDHSRLALGDCFFWSVEGGKSSYPPHWAIASINLDTENKDLSTWKWISFWKMLGAKEGRQESVKDSTARVCTTSLFLFLLRSYAWSQQVFAGTKMDSCSSRKNTIQKHGQYEDHSDLKF